MLLGNGPHKAQTSWVIVFNSPAATTQIAPLQQQLAVLCGHDPAIIIITEQLCMSKQSFCMETKCFCSSSVISLAVHCLIVRLTQTSHAWQGQYQHPRS